jgi:hypothetical protein
MVRLDVEPSTEHHIRQHLQVWLYSIQNLRLAIVYRFRRVRRIHELWDFNDVSELSFAPVVCMCTNMNGSDRDVCVLHHRRQV